MAGRGRDFCSHTPSALETGGSVWLPGVSLILNDSRGGLKATKKNPFNNASGFEDITLRIKQSGPLLNWCIPQSEASLHRRHRRT